MSMTRGPIVPPSTGSCTDLPVASSVSVTVPVVRLLPSIDAPHIAAPRRRLFDIRQNMPLSWDSQTLALSRSREITGRRGEDVGNPAEALLASEHGHHGEDAGRGCRAGQRRPQGLRDRPELHPFLLGKAADHLFERRGMPI